MIEIILALAFGILIGVLFAYFYFRAKVELIARKLGTK